MNAPDASDHAVVMQQIGELIRTQDNRCTSDPLFLVQEKKRMYGMDPDYCEDYDWLSEDHEAVADEIERAGLDVLDDKGVEIKGWEKAYYIDQWEFVTVCFTEQACKDYIEANGHNLNEPRIYAASAYRNREMIAIREMLKSGSMR
jgi:hypothetical protein